MLSILHVNTAISYSMRVALLNGINVALTSRASEVSDYVFSYVIGIIILSINYNIAKSYKFKIIKRSYKFRIMTQEKCEVYLSFCLLFCLELYLLLYFCFIS